MISEPETPAPVTPAPRGRTLGKRRPRSVISSEASRRRTRQQVAQEAVCITITALPELPEAPYIPALTPSGHSTTIVLAEGNTPGRSDRVMAQFLRDPAVLKADIIFVQEPWDNPFQDLTYHPAKATHQLLYPTKTDIGDERARVCLFISRQKVLGSLWLEPGTTTRDEAGAKTTIDLVLGSQDLTPRLVACEITKKIHADSDHLPIRTLIDIQTKTPEAQRRRNWKAYKVKDLQAFVDLNLHSKAFLLENKQHIELAIEFLIETACIYRDLHSYGPYRSYYGAGLGPLCEGLKPQRKSAGEGPAAGTPDLGQKGHRGRPRGMWRLARWARNRDASGGLVPILKTPDNGLAETAEQKVEILEAAIATRIAYALEEHSLLPREHLEGRKGISVDHLIQLLMDVIFNGWGRGQKHLLEWALDKAAIWSQQHSSRFAPDKFELIHFRNPLEPDPGAEKDTPCDYTEPWKGENLTNVNREDESAWEIPVEPQGHNQLPIKDHATGHVIRPVKHAKYLGIWLDKTLSFTTHCTKAVAKANGSLEALRSISTSTWGTFLLNMRTIYLAVVIPSKTVPASDRTDYGLFPGVNQEEKPSGDKTVRVIPYRGAEVKEGEPPIDRKPKFGYVGVPKGARARPVGAPTQLRGATVSIRAGKVRKKYLGVAADSTVYVGELEGVKMALKWAEAAPITVFSDSQAAIQAVQNPGRPSGQIQAQWAKWWERQRVGKPTKRLIPKLNKKVPRIFKGLSKSQTSIIIQMRTMRIGLRHFLFKIKQVDSDRCGCESGSQTPNYVLMECSLHLASRKIMMERLDSIEGLRGRIQDYDAVINHPQAIRYVADFMQRTGLLQQFRFATFKDEEDEEVPGPSTLLEGLELNEEDDGYIEH
ncbi:uncharacterized protein KD926_003172 [Aspergillus affinis]|uniref:uncharacterized protein n=1 Tax=Aspergillus affinis TaxID=1070780 RepID=UPI0022FED4DE|nr:uncharacterized protein KD926_003172 [Aspergillus affinis]KAI9035632.1 hypothetical protein KD926_003172 [Aspergillus affinis]